MKRKHFALIMVIIFVSSIVALGKGGIMGELAGEDAMVTINKTGNQKSSVTFNHTLHKQYGAKYFQKCKTCHHVETPVLLLYFNLYARSCKDAGCHDDAEKDAGGKRVHATCIQKCHTTKTKMAPTTCTDKRCHS